MLNKDNHYYTEVSVAKMFTSQILKQQRGAQFLRQHKTQKHGSPFPLVGISAKCQCWKVSNRFSKYFLEVSMKDYSLVTLFIQGTKAETLV